MAEIVCIPEIAIAMLSCLGKIDNLPRTVKAGGGRVLFLFSSFFKFIPHERWPAVRPSWSHNHTYGLLLVLFFSVENISIWSIQD